MDEPERAAVARADEQARPPDASDGARPAQEVRRRRVLFIHGYDPQQAEHYRRLVGLELRRFSKLWGAFVRISPGLVEHPATPGVSWTIRTTAGAAQVETIYEVLLWGDIVRRDFATSLPLKLAFGFATLWHMFATGVFLRVLRAAPWYAIAWLYPFLTAIACIAVGAAAGAVAASLVHGYGVHAVVAAAVGLLVWFAVTTGLVEALRRAGTYVVHLIDDGRSQRRYVMKQDAALHCRIDAFAERVRAAVEEGDVDEVIVVGHSSGSFVAIDAVARAYERAPDLGERTPLALVTLGATELLVAFHPKAGWLRERMRRLALERRLFWAECVGVWDTLNFPHRDPIGELGLDVPADRPNPTFRRTFITKMLRQATVDHLERRWKVFRVHFQFIMANEVQGPYDYFALVCGPWLARSQFERTRKGAYMSPNLGRPVRPPRAPAADAAAKAPPG